MNQDIKDILKNTTIKSQIDASFVQSLADIVVTHTDEDRLSNRKRWLPFIDKLLNIVYMKQLLGAIAVLVLVIGGLVLLKNTGIEHPQQNANNQVITISKEEEEKLASQNVQELDSSLDQSLKDLDTSFKEIDNLDQELKELDEALSALEQIN